MTGVMTMGAAVAALQEISAEQVDGQADHGNGNGFIEADRCRREKPLEGFRRHQQGHNGQNNRTAETAENPDFPGAEAVARIIGVASCVTVGKSGDAQRGGMGSHVPAVGQEGHGAVNETGKDFDGHHDDRQKDHLPGIFFTPEGCVVKAMVVPPLL